jgi:hypothetical protein
MITSPQVEDVSTSTTPISTATTSAMTKPEMIDDDASKTVKLSAAELRRQLADLGADLPAPDAPEAAGTASASGDDTAEHAD